MSYQFEFDSTNRILRCRFEGHVTDEDLKEYYVAASLHVAKINPRSVITDMSAVTTSDVSSETIRELAGLRPTLPEPSLPRFIVAPSPPIFGLARMFELEGELTRPNLHTVRNLKEVWAILGIVEPKFQPMNIH
jgi:hypothetical protein